MRLLITADLHYNHPKSRPVADDLIDRMNTAGGDTIVLVGDTAVADGDSLERCLSRFSFAGPKLFVAGNHELWTAGPDSYQIFKETLPDRVRNLGWHWLQTDPWVTDGVAVVGNVGWYDYTYAPPELGIPARFYRDKISPGAARRFPSMAHLFQPSDDILPIADEIVARWNDGKFVKLGRPDAAFLQECLDQLQTQLTAVATVPTVVAAVHHVPFRELLPPPHSAQWDFVKAYLGSPRLGQLLLSHSNVRRVYCGHSHLRRTADLGDLSAVNIGSGYREKTFDTVDV